MNLGDTIPNIVLKRTSKDEIIDFDLHKNFKDRNVLMICVPGAYTSTCHNKHLPPYIKNSNFLKKEKNIDDIYCVSVNDPYVMQQWSISLKAMGIIFLSDGNAEFAKEIQLLKPYKHNLMGMRLKRSVIRIENLIINKIITDDSGLLETSYEEILKNL
ncbi:peroxiredoxin [Alphaproteobacteria bacterium]|nr:peroxiredoxin [Alphaproteobacteria bacterium]MDB9824820.1 peroxiredoxin [Alphaproteobacteria bacterium]